MGRLIFNQPLDSMISFWGVPALRGEAPITLDFPIDVLRSQFPEFPPTGKLKLTFVNNQVQRLGVFPDLDARELFAFLFQYKSPVDIKVDVSQTTGLYNATICLGDGIGADIQMTGSGDNYTLLYYNEAFTAPYDLLEAQDYHPLLWNPVLNVEYQWLSERAVTDADLEGLDAQERYILWNSIYARKGLIFHNSGFSEVFKRQSWYEPRYPLIQFRTEIMPQLSAIEQSNLRFLKQRFGENRQI